MESIILYWIGMIASLAIKPNSLPCQIGWVSYSKLADRQQRQTRKTTYGTIVSYMRVTATRASVEVANDGKSLIFTKSEKINVPINGRPSYEWFTTKFGIRVNSNQVKLWANYGGNFRVIGLDEFKRLMSELTMGSDYDWGKTYSIIQMFLAYHGVATQSVAGLDQNESRSVVEYGLLKLCAPMVIEYGLDPYLANTPWTMYCMQAKNQDEFFNRLCRDKKVPKDLRKVILQGIATGAQFIEVGRLYGLVDIPNLRSFTSFATYYSYEPIKNMEMLNVLAKRLKNIAPQRRMMFVSALWGPREEVDMGGPRRFHVHHSFWAFDLLRLIEEAKEYEILAMPVNVRNIRQFHDDLLEPLNVARELRMEQQRIEMEAKYAEQAVRNAELATEYKGTIIDNNIEVVFPSSNEEIIGWGTEQRHCIGTYAGQWMMGRTLLIGFRRDGKWVGHCSIENGHVTQLLAKANTQLSKDDHKVIKDWLVSSGFAKK